MMKNKRLGLLLVVLVTMLMIPAASFAASCKHFAHQENAAGGTTYCADNTYPYYFNQSRNVPGHHLREYGTDDLKYQHHDPDATGETRNES